MAMLKNKRNQPSNRTLIKGLAFVTQIAFLIIACVFVGVFLGSMLDRWLGTSPWLLLLFSFLGVAAAFKALYDLLKKMGTP
jgi:ATP synthase protein I